MMEKLTKLHHCKWKKEAIPQEIKNASKVHLYKRKGNPQVYDYHRGISLLLVAGKILANVLLNRLNEHLPESRCSLRKDGKLIDINLTARRLPEKYQELSVDIYNGQTLQRHRLLICP